MIELEVRFPAGPAATHAVSVQVTEAANGAPTFEVTGIWRLDLEVGENAWLGRAARAAFLAERGAEVERLALEAYGPHAEREAVYRWLCGGEAAA